MLCSLSEIKIIRNQMRYNRNLEIRKKVILSLLAFRCRNISLACQRLGYQRSYFYFWFNRLKGANFDMKSVLERSRKPFSHPKKTSPEIVERVVSLRKQANYGPERLQYHQEQLYNLHLPKSTIGYILKRENLIPPKISEGYQECLKSIAYTGYDSFSTKPNLFATFWEGILSNVVSHNGTYPLSRQ